MTILLSKKHLSFSSKTQNNILIKYVFLQILNIDFNSYSKIHSWYILYQQWINTHSETESAWLKRTVRNKCKASGRSILTHYSWRRRKLGAYMARRRSVSDMISSGKHHQLRDQFYLFGETCITMNSHTTNTLFAVRNH